jgi:hypothetical protein
MTDDTPTDEHYQEMDFEREDLAPKPILLFLLALVVGCVLLALLLRGMYSYLDSSENRHQPVPSPLVEQITVDTRIVSPEDITKFPQPRLEGDERSQINDFREQEEQTLNSYGWVDQQSGVVRIPIDRAMQLIAQRGLPTRAEGGTIPPSVVNMGKDVTRASDTSAAPAKRK